MEEQDNMSDLSESRDISQVPVLPSNYTLNSKATPLESDSLMGEEYSQSNYSRGETISESQYTQYSNKSAVRHLPIANVSRVMKKILNSETKISKESKEMV